MINLFFWAIVVLLFMGFLFSGQILRDFEELLDSNERSMT